MPIVCRPVCRPCAALRLAYANNKKLPNTNPKYHIHDKTLSGWLRARQPNPNITTQVRPVTARPCAVACGPSPPGECSRRAHLRLHTLRLLATAPLAAVRQRGISGALRRAATPQAMILPTTTEPARGLEEQHIQPQQHHHYYQQQQSVLQVLDLYSGIGGMHYALLRALKHQSTFQPSQLSGVPPGPGLRPGIDAAASGAASAPSFSTPPSPQHPSLHVVAVDINTLANRVYAAEFGVEPLTLDLARVTAAQLDEQLAADLWLLTPPCQPYTTTSNARRRDTADPRATSLLHLMSPAVLPAMQRPPTKLMLENVPGFVGSDSHSMMVAALCSAGYELQEFIVSPHQLGVPYSRPRYFALAVRRPLSFPLQYDCSLGPVQHPPDLGRPPKQQLHPQPWWNTARCGDTCLGDCGDQVLDIRHPVSAAEEGTCTAERTSWPGVYHACQAVWEEDDCAAPSGRAPSPRCRTSLTQFLTSTSPTPRSHSTRASPCLDREGSRRSSDEDSGLGAGGGAAAADADAATAAAAGATKDGISNSDPWVAYAVSAPHLARFWRVLDVVTPSSNYCNCFTKHYADNLLGAGSVLASGDFAARFCTRDSRGRLHFAAMPPLPTEVKTTLPRRQPPPSSPLPPTATTGSDFRSADAEIEGVPGSGLTASTDSALTHHQHHQHHQHCNQEQMMTAGSSGDGSRQVPMVWRQRPQGGMGAGGGGRRGGLGHGVVADRDKTLSSQQQQQQQDGEGDGDQQEGEVHAEAVVLGLRFFSPEEVAAIHGLPAGWAAMASAVGVQPRQQYGLLGNGLSVDVASYLLTYLLQAQANDEGAPADGEK